MNLCSCKNVRSQTDHAIPDGYKACQKKDHAIPDVGIITKKNSVRSTKNENV